MKHRLQVREKIKETIRDLNETGRLYEMITDEERSQEKAFDYL